MPPLPWRLFVLCLFSVGKIMKHWKFFLFLPSPLSQKCPFLFCSRLLTHGRAFYLLFSRVHPSHLPSVMEISTSQGELRLAYLVLPTYPFTHSPTYLLTGYLPTYLPLPYLTINIIHVPTYLSNQLPPHLPTKSPTYSTVFRQPKTLTNM